MDLPQEIYALIVDEVATELSTLRACAKASRALLYPAYPHLFSHIRLTVSTDDSKVWDFISLLRSSPHFPDVSIAPYIRTFELDLPNIRSIDVRSASNLPDSELWRVLNSFTRVEHLKVLASEYLPLSFETHQYFLSRDFVDLCHSPSLSKLSLSSITEIPIHLLHHFRFSHVDLSMVSFVSHPSEQPTFVHQLDSIVVDILSFRSIALALNGSLTYSPRLQEAFGRLRTLDLRSFAAIGLILCLEVAAACASLENLSVHIQAAHMWNRANEIKPDPTFLFHPFSSLCTLRIFSTVVWRPTSRFFINPLVSLLNQTTLPGSLQTLDIGVKTSSADADRVVESVCSPDKQTEWHRLDAVLADPQFAAVPRLRLVFGFVLNNFDVGRMDRQSDSEDLFVAHTQKAVEGALPVFRRTRILSFTGQLSVVCNKFDFSGFPSDDLIVDSY